MHLAWYYQIMYKSYTAHEWREHLGLALDYSIEGFMVFGSYQKSLYKMLQESLERLGQKAEYSAFEDEFLEPIQEFTVHGKRYWFVIAYGGALLSEYLHLACIFGSKKNILLGTCGGLLKGANTFDFVIPEWSYAEESSAKGYQPDSGHRYKPHKKLSDRLAALLESDHVVHRGPTITYQAMLAETWDDVINWSAQGYIGVEMEAATVFAVSKHFGVPAAALLRVGDNLIGQETLLTMDLQKLAAIRHKVSQQAFDVALSELLSTGIQKYM